MKTPRIYLYFSNPEFRGFIVPDLRSLAKDLGELGDRAAFIHIGFRHIEPDEILNVLNDLPHGVYCSHTFFGCDPGDDWSFSRPVANIAKTHSVHFVSRSPVFDRPEPGELATWFAPNHSSDHAAHEPYGKRVVKNMPMAAFDWSVRTANAFANKNIVYLSDMVGLTKDNFLAIPNFGRKSLKEVEVKLAEINLSFTDLAEGKLIFETPNVSSENSHDAITKIDNFYGDIYECFVESCDERELLVLEMRLGVKGDPATLEAIGDLLKVTRERVRQIEAKVWKRSLAQIPNLIDSWYYEIENRTSISLFPISPSDLLGNDPEFSDETKTLHLLKCLFRYYPKYGRPRSDRHLSLIPYAGAVYVTSLTEVEVSELAGLIEQRLIDSPGQSEKAIKRSIWALLQPAHKQFTELIWRKLWARALTKEVGGELVLVKYLRRSGAEKACEALIVHIEEVGEAISNTEAEEFFEAFGAAVSSRSCFNFMANHPEIFPARHGSWTTMGVLSPKSHEISAINDTVEEISAGAKEEFHSRELIPRLMKIGVDRYDEFNLAGILKNQAKYTYLGRNMFACPGSKLEERTKIHDVLVKVLQSENRPLHANELIKKASEFRSIDSGMQIQAKPPIVLLGSNVFGLDYWEA